MALLPILEFPDPRLRTKAVPSDDGSYRITGQKIWISAGEHDMADNIVHLVLARLPDAPPGIKGISLFVVPKFLVNDDGSLGERNGIYCGGLEHKMGIHGNATAQIVIDGAIGTMVGQPNKGMQAMFVMMNAARLGVGNQSLGLTEVAYQNALAYAKDRIQMRSLSGTKAKDKPADPIIVHPDVRKMLLTAKAYAEGGRALAVFCSVLLEKVHHHPDEKVRKDSDEMLSLLTPIVKAFLTDNGYQAATMCQQVFGGQLTAAGVVATHAAIQLVGHLRAPGHKRQALACQFVELVVVAPLTDHDDAADTARVVQSRNPLEVIGIDSRCRTERQAHAVQAHRVVRAHRLPLADDLDLILDVPGRLIKSVQKKSWGSIAKPRSNGAYSLLCRHPNTQTAPAWRRICKNVIGALAVSALNGAT